VLAQYLFRINGATPTDWQLKGVAIAGYTVATLRRFHTWLKWDIPLLIIEIVVAMHTRFSFWLTNGIGAVKLLTLLFISITGWVVLSGRTSVPDPHINFQNAFEGKATPYGLTNALVKIIFSYAGYENAFNVVNEVKVRAIHSRKNDILLTRAKETSQDY
jgi:amino acid transporter